MKTIASFWTGGGLILLAATCFGLQSSLVKKLLLMGSNPFQILVFELAVASLLFAGASLALRKPLFIIPPRAAVRVWLWGAIGVGGTGVALYGAVERIPIALAVVLLFYYVPWVFLLEFLFLKIRPSARRWAALVLILGGTMLASDVMTVAWEDLEFTGIFLGLASGVSYGTFIFGIRRLGEVGTALSRSFVICAGTFLLFATISLYRPATVFVPPEGILLPFLLLVVAVALLGQVFPLLAFSRAIPIIGGSLAAIIASVELPVACLMAFLLLGEHLRAAQWLGILLITAAVVVANWRTFSRSAEP